MKILPKAKDAFDNITKERTGGESRADRVKKLLSTSERKHLPVLFTNTFHSNEVWETFYRL